MSAYELELEPASDPSTSGETTVTINHIEVIETVISSLQEDQSAMVSHTDEGYLWKFKYGTVEVFVQLPGTTDEDTLTVWASILKLPVQREAELLRKLMEMNWSSTFEARFALVGNEVVVCAQRTGRAVSC